MWDRGQVPLRLRLGLNLPGKVVVSAADDWGAAFFIATTLEVCSVHPLLTWKSGCLLRACGSVIGTLGGALPARPSSRPVWLEFRVSHGDFLLRGLSACVCEVLGGAFGNFPAVYLWV